jgi:hypothetical protein
MRAMARRVHRLEKQFAPRLDDQGRSIVDVIRERRHRRLAAEGKEPEPELPRKREDYYDANGRPLSIAQIIINASSRRIQLRAQAEAASHKHD